MKVQSLSLSLAWLALMACAGRPRAERGEVVRPAVAMAAVATPAGTSSVPQPASPPEGDDPRGQALVEASAPVRAGASEGDTGSPAPPPAVADWMALERGGPLAVRVISPAHEAGPAPLTVLLHGLCNDPRITCDWFREGDLGPTWQVCPAGNVSCGAGAFQWGVGPRQMADRVARSAMQVREAHAARVASTGAVLVGFSQGAFAIVGALREHLDGFVGVVLVGASAAPTADQLRAAGVQRIGFAAGDGDGAAASMRRAAASLAKHGIDARFVSLGRVGHLIPDSTSPVIGSLIEWSRGDGR